MWRHSWLQNVTQSQAPSQLSMSQYQHYHKHHQLNKLQEQRPQYHQWTSSATTTPPAMPPTQRARRNLLTMSIASNGWRRWVMKTEGAPRSSSQRRQPWPATLIIVYRHQNTFLPFQALAKQVLDIWMNSIWCHRQLEHPYKPIQHQRRRCHHHPPLHLVFISSLTCISNNSIPIMQMTLDIPHSSTFSNSYIVRNNSSSNFISISNSHPNGIYNNMLLMTTATTTTTTTVT